MHDRFSEFQETRFLPGYEPQEEWSLPLSKLELEAVAAILFLPSPASIVDVSRHPGFPDNSAVQVKLRGGKFFTVHRLQVDRLVDGMEMEIKEQFMQNELPDEF